MTVKQKQCLLAYLGYDTGGIDGIWGSRSEKAAAAFLKRWGNEELETALKQAVANGMPEQEEVEDFWEGIQYFTREEFKCKCGGKYCNGYPAEPQEALVRIADQLRKNLGVPITIVSGLRCAAHNANVGGVANSQHMYGEAADIYARGISQGKVEAELDKIGGVRYHYAISGSRNVHFDIPKGER